MVRYKLDIDFAHHFGTLRQITSSRDCKFQTTLEGWEWHKVTMFKSTVIMAAVTDWQCSQSLYDSLANLNSAYDPPTTVSWTISCDDSDPSSPSNVCGAMIQGYHTMFDHTSSNMHMAPFQNSSNQSHLFALFSSNFTFWELFLLSPSEEVYSYRYNHIRPLLQTCLALTTSQYSNHDLMANEQRLWYHWYGVNLTSKSQWSFTLHECGHGKSFPCW